MLAYGLFLARLNSDSEPITLHNAREHVPGSFRLIRELVDFLTELEKTEYRDVRWVVEEVLSIVNALNLPAIHEDLSFRNRRAISRMVRAGDEEEHRLFERDPFIYFYEDYLKAYDPAMRKGRGVYYTPPPVVNFIVRGVDDILKDRFGIRIGLADHRRVTVLDFACGTGTFLLEVCQRIFDNIGGPDAGRAEPTVREHILENLFGFEYLIAPYTIAHLKLSQYLLDEGHRLKIDERLQIFLTNTLEPVKPQANFLLPAVSAEVEAAQKVKDRDILVIVGNPPYSGISRNMGIAAQELIERYKYVDGVHFRERKHWLQDDYVKFIAFAQKKMDSVKEGIVGVITNHSWLDNPTFRGMRQSLMHTFEEIHILDLHGSAKKKEQAPDASKDENVFDIEQGVAIALFVKRPSSPKIVRHADLWGSRLEKYSALAEGSLASTRWTNLNPTSPNFLLRPAVASDDTYSNSLSVLEMFPTRSTGVQTSRDHLVIGFSKEEVLVRLDSFADPDVSDDYFRETFFREHRTGRYLRGDTRGWKLSEGRKWSHENLAELRSSIKLITYRPFDNRYVVGHPKMIDWPRNEVMQHFRDGNIALLLPRQLAAEGFQHSFCAEMPAEMCVISTNTKEQNYVFPLWLHPGDGASVENLSREFRAYIDARYEHHYTPEEIIGYAYAVLHAPTYRTRYAENLRTDFPRLPFPESSKEFERLSVFGWALVQAHLLREVPRPGLAAYHGKGDHAVEGVSYSAEEQTITINETQFFERVPPAVWEFRIGGYQVLDKYLKSRKGRELSLDEINHVAAIADSLAFTIDQMVKIDKGYLAAFPDRG
jgi:predicted helicase